MLIGISNSLYILSYEFKSNIKKLRDQLNMIYWNTEGFKYGICNTP